MKGLVLMENKWKEIWEKKSRLNSIVLECLIKADGFDSFAGDNSVNHWREYIRQLFKIVAIEPNHSIFDVGCGSGAFLYEHHLSGGVVGGIDYSSHLIGIAQGFMPFSDFTFGDAREVNATPKYDVVTSHSVFQYFDDCDMAEAVINCMIEKSNKTIAILDINDERLAGIYHEKRIENFKVRGLTEIDYWDKYNDLKFMFYSKEFFEAIGHKNNLHVSILPQNNPNNWNAEMRFNVVFNKL